MKQATFMVMISVDVEFDESMTAEQAKLDLEQNCRYSIPETANIKVTDTEWFETVVMED